MLVQGPDPSAPGTLTHHHTVVVIGSLYQSTRTSTRVENYSLAAALIIIVVIIIIIRKLRWQRPAVPLVITLNV